MGELGNFFYCVPNSCSRISYLPYEASTTYVRYRFKSSDEWILVLGDTWDFISTSSHQYVLRIFNAGRFVYGVGGNQEPEVELIRRGGNCKLSETFEEITIDKLPYLERIEIRNQKIETIYVSPLEAPLIETSPLPEHCYHIYKTAISAPPILSEYVPIPGLINPYQFIAEICSSEECPPPEFEVLCDCGCESCPEGTCATICDGYVCCNDITTGQLVSSIPVENYCEDT